MYPSVGHWKPTNQDREVIYNLSYTIPHLTYLWCSLFIQKRLWGLNHGGITIPPFTEEMLQGLQRDIKFQWIPSHCGVMDNETADYLAKGTKISQTSVCKLTFQFAQLKIKRGIQVDLSEYYAIQSQHKSWGKTVENRNIVPDFPRGDAVAIFRLITGRDCLAAHLYGLSLCPSPMCVLCREANSIMNQGHILKCSSKY
jgi:hypothetical protein